MRDWLNKLLAEDDGNNLGKLAPLVIFFVIWVVGAIAKAAKKGKEGAGEQVAESQEKHEPGFDELAKKIRERYSAAKEQANRGAQQEENASSQPPARVFQPKPPPRRPVPMAAKKPVAYPMQNMPEQEGPTLRVVKSLEHPNVDTPLKVEKPTLQKVEPGLQKVEGITSDVPMVSTEIEIPHKEHPYLEELAAQYATQEGLRKAILNYEIIGPPLALRDLWPCESRFIAEF